MSIPAWLESALSTAHETAVAPAPPAAYHRALERVLAGNEPGLRDVALLLGAADVEAQDEFLVVAADARRKEFFGARVGLFAPLYYSNGCRNDCLYCGFRSSLGSTRRRSLTPEEIRAEARALLAQGHRRILLIAAEDPTSRGAEKALEAVEAVASEAPIARGTWEEGSTHGLFLAGELPPMSSADFARLAGRGLSAYVLFQETYDPELYPTVHPSGPKADFGLRLAAPERAAAAGIPSVGLGALYGLGNPILETVCLVAHARHLEMLTGRPVASVSAPRLEPAEGVPFTFHPPSPVPDRVWLRILAVLRLALPGTNLIVSTRESMAQRRASLRVGATVLSAGSRTDPGGYAAPDETRAQFRLGDERPLDAVRADLVTMGYLPTMGGEAPAPTDRAEHGSNRRRE